VDPFQAHRLKVHRRRRVEPKPEAPAKGLVTQGVRSVLEPPPFRRGPDNADALIRQAAELARSRVDLGRIENR
jgi:hypothetical protein